MPGADRTTRTGRALRKKRRRRRLLVALWLVAAVLVGTTSFTGGLLAAEFDDTLPPPPRSAVLVDADGRVFATIRSPQLREDVTADAIPQVLREAIVAAEDERFFDHEGVDPLAITRAAYRDLTGGLRQGGSTITQQYVKNVYTGNDRTAQRKIKEAALALRLESRLSKEEILTLYLNQLYLGNGTYGVQAASKHYFGVPVSELTLPQAAMLAGIVPAPSVYNPRRDMEAARTRQLYTLNRMVVTGAITAQQASDAYRVEPEIAPEPSRAVGPTLAPEFRDMVKRQVVEDLPEGQDLFSLGGLQVRTTLDLDLQQAAVETLADVLPSEDDPEAAIVAIDPRTGDIKALTTKREGGYQQDGFNLATQQRRTSASTIKPFTLLRALDEGETVDSVRPVPSCETIVPARGSQPRYRPCNFGESGEGGHAPTSLGDSLVNSYNTVYAQLAQDVGTKDLLATARAVGLDPAEDQLAVPAIGLGLEVTPLGLTRGYATLAADGVRRPTRSILEVRAGVDESGEGGGLLSAAPVEVPGEQVVPAADARAVAEVLAAVPTPEGTAPEAEQPYPIFGKTGTAQKFTNAWFVGCTDELCVATYLGHRKNDRPMRDVAGVDEVTGGSVPTRIFAETLQRHREIQAEQSGPVNLRPPRPSSAPG